MAAAHRRWSAIEPPPGLNALPLRNRGGKDTSCRFVKIAAQQGLPSASARERAADPACAGKSCMIAPLRRVPAKLGHNAFGVEHFPRRNQRIRFQPVDHGAIPILFRF
jgi:hypothetical protein